MKAEDFLKENKFYYENYIYNHNDERYELAQLLTDYAESLQLLQSRVVGRSEQFNCFNAKFSDSPQKCMIQCDLCKPKNI